MVFLVVEILKTLIEHTLTIISIVHYPSRDLHGRLSLLKSRESDVNHLESLVNHPDPLLMFPILEDHIGSMQCC